MNNFLPSEQWEVFGVSSYVTKGDTENGQQIREKLTEIEKKIESIEESHYVLKQMPKESFDRFYVKYTSEKKNILDNLEKLCGQISNPETYFKAAMIVSQRVNSTWGKSDISIKERLQKLVFPEGLEYNRKEEAFRTPKVNLIFRTIDYFSSGKRGNKKGLPPFLREQSRLAGWKDRLSSYEPIHFDPFPSNPEIRFQVTKIQLPADFLLELDKIEAFYDLHLQELVPISVGDRDNSQQAKENPCYANSSKLVE